MKALRRRIEEKDIGVEMNNLHLAFGFRLFQPIRHIQEYVTYQIFKFIFQSDVEFLCSFAKAPSSKLPTWI